MQEEPNPAAAQPALTRIGRFPRATSDVTQLSRQPATRLAAGAAPACTYALVGPPDLAASISIWLQTPALYFCHHPYPPHFFSSSTISLVNSAA